MSRDPRILKTALLVLGGVSIPLGIALIQANVLLAEIALLTGINFVEDGQPTTYTAPWFLYVAPISLIVGGVASVALGVAPSRASERVPEGAELRLR